MHKLIAGLAAGLVVLVAAPVALAAPITSSIRVEGADRTRCFRGPRTADDDRATSPRSAHRATRPCRRRIQRHAGAPECRARRGDWDAVRWAQSFDDFEIPRSTGRDANVDADDTTQHYLADSGQLQVVEHRRLRRLRCSHGDDVLFFPYALRCAERRPGARRARRRRALGQAFGVQRRQYADDVSTRCPARRRRSRRPPARTVTAVGDPFTRGRRRHRGDVRRTRSALEPACVREGRLRALGDRAGLRAAAARTARRRARRTRPTRSGRRRRWASRTARCSRARRHRGRCAATWPRTRRGCPPVKIRLLRKTGKKCSFFSGGRERFRKTHLCWHGAFFKIGDRADWSYLLPKRLGRGRYRLEAYGIDGVLNRGPIKRIGFRVR